MTGTTVSNKKLIELTDEQFKAFTMLFPHLQPVNQQKEKERPHQKNNYREQIEAAFKKKFPFS